MRREVQSAMLYSCFTAASLLIYSCFTLYIDEERGSVCCDHASEQGAADERGLKLLVHAALAASVCSLKLLVHAALSYQCVRPEATSVCGLTFFKKKKVALDSKRH